MQRKLLVMMQNHFRIKKMEKYELKLLSYEGNTLIILSNPKLIKKIIAQRIKLFYILFQC